MKNDRLTSDFLNAFFFIFNYVDIVYYCAIVFNSIRFHSFSCLVPFPRSQSHWNCKLTVCLWCVCVCVSVCCCTLESAVERPN